MILPFQKLRTLNRVEILRKNLERNFEIYQKNCPQQKIFPTIKANGYGHGAREIFSILDRFDPPYFAVDSYFEALKIWKIRKRPILLIGPNIPENLAHFHRDFLTISVGNFETLRAVCALKKPLPIHLKFNTGMNRQGFEKSDLPEIFALLKKYPKVYVEGVFSHFSDADNWENHFTEKQNAKFTKILNAFFEHKICPKWIHLGNSAGCLKTRDPRINAARIGIGLYGNNPLDPRDALFQQFQGLKPPMRIVSTIINIHELQKGDKVSYNCTFTAPQKMRVGVVPFGYYEGIDRGQSNAGSFKIGENFGKICGRVCMNLTVFEVPESAKIGDEVILLSENLSDLNSAPKIAKMTGTISYEVFTRISPTIRRKIV